MASAIALHATTSTLLRSIPQQKSGAIRFQRYDPRNNYLAALYTRLAARRGGKRAVIAVAHTILVIVFHMLKRRTDYQELGPDYFDRMNERRITHALVRRLERLGHTVILQPA